MIDQAVTGKLLSPAEVRHEVHWEIIAAAVGAVLGALLILMKRLTD
jgi:DNA-binding transcriptional regulator YdaS (Cro superfamily)